MHDIGTGKTLSAIWMNQMFWKPKKILVICPRSAFRGWRRDLDGHTDWSYVVVEGEREERVDKLHENHKLYLINYEGLKSMYGGMHNRILRTGFTTKAAAQEFVRGVQGLKAMKDPKDPTKWNAVQGFGWRIDHTQFHGEFDAMIFDEVHRCGGNKSIQTMICLELSRRAKYVIGMTGTLGTDLFNLWSMARAIDLGQCLGTGWWNYRNQFFNEVKVMRKDGTPARYTEWKPKPGARQQIMNLLLPIATSFSREECLDLPPAVYQIRDAQASPEQRKIFKQLMDGLAIEYTEGNLTPENILNKSSKLRQACGGFIYLKDGDERSIHVFKKNPKLDLLEELYEETAYKIVVWHEFVEEGRIIEAWAQRKGIQYASLRAEIKNKEEQERRFIEDPNVQLMIAHPKCASESLDFSHCQVTFFYSTGGSVIQRQQAEGRTRRKNQKRKQFFVDAVITGSADEITTQRMNNDKQMEQSMLEYIRTFGKSETRK